jgi:hypothetical protein
MRISGLGGRQLKVVSQRVVNLERTGPSLANERTKKKVDERGGY